MMRRDLRDPVLVALILAASCIAVWYLMPWMYPP